MLIFINVNEVDKTCIKNIINFVANMFIQFSNVHTLNMDVYHLISEAAE